MYHRRSAAPTPPMGWNSWDCYGAGITEKDLLANAEYMAAHLKEYGWQYVVCDIQWYEPTAVDTDYNNFAPLCMDEYSRLIPAPNRFPSAADGKGFAPIAEKIHAMGLKFGVHMLRGIPRQAVHSGALTKSGVPAREIASQYSICPWNTDMYGVDHTKNGAQAYYDSVFELYASWGVDYVKVDDIANTEFLKDHPYSAEKEIEMIRAAIDRCGRSIVLSLSPGPAPIGNARHLAANADLWRMSGDFWDRRDKLIAMFRLCERWYAYVGDGRWPDCDMLPVGRLMVTHRKLGSHYTRFTHDEQITMMNLWCVFRSPLMIGAELRDNDDFTLKLLTNAELLAVNQRSTRPIPAVCGETQEVWQNMMEDGTPVAALFNLSEQPRRVCVTLEALGLSGRYALYDVWRHEVVGETEDEISALLPATGSAVYLLQSCKNC
ncbi:MAG: glycoside hydrolase family 27 protein [Clostridia bacterium]|nr:glycoside hydrolase family 27 protein [Clostridia bacterium]